MKVLNAFSRSLFLFGTVIIIGTESLTPIKYNISSNSITSNNNNNRIQTKTTTPRTIHKASRASSIMEEKQQQEAQQICPFLSPPEDPTTTFEAAMGWFWGPQRDFDREEGIVDTVVGYSGSVSRLSQEDANPTYRNVQDYAESIRITFNTDKLKYEDLLNMYFEMHTPYGNDSTQYRSAIFVYTPEQKLLAEAACKARGNTGSYVTVEEASDFYRGEEYHQKYIEKKTTSRY